MVGYATVYTMAPMFSLVLDRDVSEDLALLYPKLYKELTNVCHYIFLSLFRRLIWDYQGRALSYKTFFQWLIISLYQGSIYDHVLGALRKRIPAHRIYLIYSPHPQRITSW